MCVDFVAGEGINFGSKIFEFSILEGIKICVLTLLLLRV